jgi:glutathione synthase/RimK-type ligase-like ATP-grasp enzyme
MRRVLVTGAGGSPAANFVHSLRLAPERFHVVGTDTSKFHLELAPVDARYLLPRADDPQYLDELNAVVAAEQVDLVHPQPEQEVLVLAGAADWVGAATFLPTPEAVALCQDKAAFAARMAEAGLPTPRFARAESEEALREATASILESRERAWVRAVKGAGAKASLPVSSPDQAAAWVRYWREIRGLGVTDFMVSEFLPGRELAFQSIWSDGEIVTSAARERLEYVFGHLMPSGQSSSPSVARTVHRDDVNELATQAVRAVDPAATGVFCVDLKEDEHDRPLVTEINAGRFFTTSNFLATAGANMPYEYVRLAAGETVDGLPRYDAVEEGLYWIRMIDMGYKLVREGEWQSRRLAS